MQRRAQDERYSQSQNNNGRSPAAMGQGFQDVYHPNANGQRQSREGGQQVARPVLEQRRGVYRRVHGGQGQHPGHEHSEHGPPFAPKHVCPHQEQG